MGTATIFFRPLLKPKNRRPQQEFEALGTALKMNPVRSLVCSTTKLYWAQ